MRAPTLFIGCITFVALLLLALVFYLERIAHIDMAFQTFLILKSGSIEIQSGRFGAAATQVWPWLAQEMGLPLRGVLLAYSMGHVLCGAILFGWCCWLRQWQWATVLVLVVTGISTHTFYWLSEMPQGLVFLVAVFAWMSSQGSLAAIRWWQWPLWIAAVVTAFYFHPMVLYAAVFGCLFFLLGDHKDTAGASFWKHRSLFAAMLLIFALVAFVKYKLLKLDWYDAIALERADTFRQLWPHWLDLPSNRDFLHWCLTDYYFVPLALLLSAGFYGWKKKWLKLVLTVGYPIGYLLLVNVPFHESAQQFYMENLWLPLGLFAAIPLVFDVLPGLFSQKGAVVIISLVAATGLARILLAHQSWTARLEWEQDFLKKTAAWPARKLVLSEDQVPKDTLKMVWGTPYEFLLLSSLEAPDLVRCILVTNEPGRYDSTLLSQPHLFLGTFKNYPFEALPERYFQFRDTSHYVRL